MATNGNSGYPLKWFKDQNTARQAWECAICLEILKDPVQIRDCGHQFCALCIDDILKADPRCPSCRIGISDANIFEDHAARRVMKQLEVNCCNEGCIWQGCLGSLLQDHQSTCSGNNVKQLGVEKLEQKLESFMVKVSTLERKEKKHEEDMKELRFKHEEDIKQLQLRYENELNLFKSKHDEDMRLLGQKIEVLQAINSAHAHLSPQQPITAQQGLAVPDYTWKIANFTRKLAQANSNNDYGAIETEPFFSSHGYKMRVFAHLNEGPNGKSGYMGIYIQLIKGDRDGSLPWPFTKPVTFDLVDQQDDPNKKENIRRAFVPEGQRVFKRPEQRENEGYGCICFVKHSTLRTRQYIRDHAVYIKVSIDP